ncbi:hypothetical protein [Seonamhaeicola sp. ML3]|uniref:hypothetical protein n=1 Tax=Seonamhaeicola sp. ML3 TaxID=2937786 RepID=UPI00200D6A6E|nr:hypothetical protein [Seonamhaeicola sp. ML3]
MKKIIITFIPLFTLLTFSCSSDDKNNEPVSVIGTWHLEYTQFNDEEPMYPDNDNILTINNDNTYNHINEPYFNHSSTWEMQDEKTIRINQWEEGLDRNFTLNGLTNESLVIPLTFSSDGDILYYHYKR